MRKVRVNRTGMLVAFRGMCFTLVACLLISCGVATLFHEECVKEEAMVLMRDSTVKSGRALLPDYRGKSFRLLLDEGRRTKISSEQVEQLRLKKGNNPASVFVYVPYKDRAGKEHPAVWMNCLGIGQHLKIAVIAGSWHYDKAGELEAVTFADGYAYIVGVKEDGKGQYLTTLGSGRTVMVRALCKFLADDVVLCHKITSKEVDAMDFAEVCRLYVPDNGVEGCYHVCLPNENDKLSAVKGGAL